jgi:phosphoribosylaminoimidazole (AIR) synthetase
MVLIVAAEDAQRTVAAFAAQGENCAVIGEIEKRADGAAACSVVS